MKIGRVTNVRIGDSIMTFILQIDQMFINYSYNDDMLSNLY